MQDQEHLLVTNFNGNPNVGLYGYCNDEFCLMGSEVSKRVCNRVSKVLKVEVHRLNLAGTSLVGIFCVGNKNKLLLPSIVFEDELEVLNKLGIKYSISVGKSGSQIRITNKKGIKLFGNYIYQNYDDIGLSRKYKKYLEITQI